MLGVAVPLTAAVESTRRDADMSRYVMTSDCPGVERCLVDLDKGKVIGLEPPHAFELGVE